MLGQIVNRAGIESSAAARNSVSNIDNRLPAKIKARKVFLIQGILCRRFCRHESDVTRDGLDWQRSHARRVMTCHDDGDNKNYIDLVVGLPVLKSIRE